MTPGQRLGEDEEKRYEYLEKEHSGQRDQQVQRPWHGMSPVCSGKVKRVSVAGME